MKTISILPAVALLTLLQAPFLRAAETNLPSLFVAPLNGNARLGVWQPAMGDGLAEMLITELTKLGKFDVLESTTLESIKDEIKMGQDGWIEPNEKVEKGHWAGADYMFVGKITRFGYTAKDFGGGHGWLPIRIPGGIGISTKEAEIQIDWRVVDTTTRKIFTSGSAAGVQKGTSWGFSSAGGSGFHREREFQDSALGKATVKALGTIIADVAKLQFAPGARAKIRDGKLADLTHRQQAELDGLRNTEGRVEAVGDGFIIVSLGSKHGLKAGDKLTLLQVIDIKNNEGKAVFKKKVPAGEVVLDTVEEESSSAHCLKPVPVQEGWAVRRASSSVSP